MNLQLVEGTSLLGETESFRKLYNKYTIQRKCYKLPLSVVSDRHKYYTLN